MKEKIEYDVLQRFIFEKAPVRGEYILLKDSFQGILSQHPYPPPIRRLLGEALCVAGLLSAIIKFDGRLTVQFRGHGKLKLLLAQCDHQFHIRGLAKWDGEISYADLMDSFHQGVLMITLNKSPGKHYQGIVSFRGNSLVESVEGYFKESEQLATKLWLAVDEKSAAGFLLQIIPSKEKEAIRIEEEIIIPHWERITQLTKKKLQMRDLLAMDYQSLLTKLYHEEEVRIFDSVPVTFHCTCSKERSENAIFIMGKQEAEEELKHKNAIVVTCDFCNKEYRFDRIDVMRIFENPPTQTKLH